MRLVTLPPQSMDRSKGLSDEGKGVRGKGLRLGTLVRLGKSSGLDGVT